MITEAVLCLALNVYFEARNQPLAGQIAVSQVVMNRVESEYFPDTACDVITQGPTRPSWKDPQVEYPVRNRCQFSWYCDGKPDEPRELEAWQTSWTVAWGVYHDQVDDLVDGALWYHAHYVTPEWAETKQPTASIGDHILYKRKDDESAY